MRKLIILFIVFCFSSNAHATCSPSGTSCSACTTYRCNSGYYGTATSASAGCTVCPENAVCAGGNESTFNCNAGYYKSGTSCISCKTATGDDASTSLSGSVSVTECYLPAGTVGTDSTGIWNVSSDCYYTN